MEEQLKDSSSDGALVQRMCGYIMSSYTPFKAGAPIKDFLPLKNVRLGENRTGFTNRRL